MIRYSCFGVSIIYKHRIIHKYYYFIKLNYVRMSYQFQYVDLPSDTLYVTHVLDFVFFKDLDCNLKSKFILKAVE